MRFWYVLCLNAPAYAPGGRALCWIRTTADMRWPYSHGQFGTRRDASAFVRSFTREHPGALYEIHSVWIPKTLSFIATGNL